MKLEQKLERVEIRLRTDDEGEADLLADLDELDGLYGGKNELMRQSLVRGYMLIKQRMESVSSTSDEVGAIDALAQAIVGGEYGYRVVKTYLHARQQLDQSAQLRSLPPADAQPKQLAVDEAVSTAAALPEKAAFSEEHSGLREQQPEQSSGVSANSGPVEQETEAEPPQPKPKANWAHMRKIAGSASSGAGAPSKEEGEQ